MEAIACPSCGSTDIETDDFNGQSQVVCTSCGQVIDQGSYYGDDDPSEGASNYCPPSGPMSVGLGSKLRSHLKAGDVGRAQDMCKNGIQWIKHTEKICHVQGLSNNMTKEVVGLFERAYKRPKFLYKDNTRKQALSGACLYITCRQYSCPMLLKTAASAVQSSTEEVTHMFGMLTKEFGIKLPPLMDVETLVPSILQMYSICDKVIEEKTLQICVLARDTWVTCGRRHEHLILAAAYIAWKSIGNNKCLSVFARMTGRKLPETTNKRVNELKEVILRLAKEIPWVNQKLLTPASVHHCLDDVLDYRKTLMMKVRPPDDHTEDSSMCNGSDDRSTFLPPCHKRKRLKGTNEHGTPLPENISTHDLACTELSNLDIPDSEIHEYIRSPEEVAECEKILKTLEDEKDTDDKLAESPPEENCDTRVSGSESETSLEAPEDVMEPGSCASTLECEETNVLLEEALLQEKSVAAARNVSGSEISPADEEKTESEKTLRWLENERQATETAPKKKKLSVKAKCVYPRKASLRPRKPLKH